ncbi:hypothetical protein OPKNFCMD_1002 [Methylobacterium crusticola]|uniref:Uncharacterized protein n=2 Tax=Methylobacterium crusticola TaxID=1697972 RepID=A0ABQ4QSH8_9HYPH|nr:hypothetical protein [Methylobacterium crusticola]GJD48285.1 hypothetical protein OPKNFCMD_1002 [Methylobacterium crusticola]
MAGTTAGTTAGTGRTGLLHLVGDAAEPDVPLPGEAGRRRLAALQGQLRNQLGHLRSVALSPALRATPEGERAAEALDRMIAEAARLAEAWDRIAGIVARLPAGDPPAAEPSAAERPAGETLAAARPVRDRSGGDGAPPGG